MDDGDGGVTPGQVEVTVGEPKDEWDATINVGTLSGLNSDLGPRTFGVHSKCDSTFEPETFINGEACDGGRIVAFDVPFKTFFYYPSNPADVGGQDGSRLLTSRIALPDPEAKVLHWRFRIELERTGTRADQSDEVVLTWNLNTIPSGYQTALLIDHNTLPANNVINMGKVSEYRVTVPSGVESFVSGVGWQ